MTPPKPPQLSGRPSRQFHHRSSVAESTDADNIAVPTHSDGVQALTLPEGFASIQPVLVKVSRLYP